MCVSMEMPVYGIQNDIIYLLAVAAAAQQPSEKLVKSLCVEVRDVRMFMYIQSKKQDKHKKEMRVTLMQKVCTYRGVSV